MNDVPSAIVDADAGQRGAADPTASVWVTASAGTGKTKVLTDRVLNLMLAGTPPQRILCITFTRAAAAQMSAIIADRLGTWAGASAGELDRQLLGVLGRAPEDGERMLARRLFYQVLDTPGGMAIQTIHAFCQSILGRFPLEAGVPPHFSVLDERDAEELRAAAREDVLAGARRDGGALARALAEVTRHVEELAFTELLAALAAERGRLARFLGESGSVEAAVASLRAVLGLAAGETAESVVAAATAEGAFDAAELRRAAGALEAGSDTDRGRASAIRHWLEATPSVRAEAFDAYASVFLTAANPPRIRERLITKKAAAAVPNAAAALVREGERVLEAVMRRRAAATAAATAALLVLGEALLTAYRRQKEVRALLDYDDLIACTCRLLEAEGNAPWVLYKLDGGVDHVLIDEAQDTSPEQWRIVRALTGEFFAGEGARERTRTVFAVGDVKQSIFSFQGADPDAFLANRDWFGGKVRAAGGVWRPMSMRISFRSTRAVLAAVDAVFANPAAADGVALDGDIILHQAYRQQDGGLVDVWPPLAARETDAPIPWRPPIERVAGDSPEARLARLVARRIARMTDGSDILESAGRPVRPGDIMVLVRRRTGFVEELVRSLKLLKVPVAGVDRMILTEHIAVMDLIALARFVLLPDDDLTLATVLKSPLIGLDEDQLFRLAYRRRGSLWAALHDKAGEDEGFASARSSLAELLALADLVPPFEFFARVLGPLGGRRRLLARLGREAEDPLAEFLDLALSFERIHAPSLEGFLAWLEGGAVEIKRDLEQGPTDTVSVMTVHGAKGLQAPIVILADTMQVPSRGPRLLWPRRPDGAGEVLVWPPSREHSEPVAEAERDRLAARQRQEYRRLLYVAMTRARDRLIVCGWRGRRREPDDCWYHLIRRGIEDAGPEIGLEEVEDAFLLAAPETDDARVLRVVCRQETVRATEAAPALPRLLPLPSWAGQAAGAEPEPPSPLVPSRPAEDEPPVRSPLGADGGRRYHRGRIIHRLLQSLPDVPAGDREAAARSWLARPVHRLDAAARDEIAREVVAVLEHPEFSQLFGPGSLAEVPLTGEIAGRVISGQVDRLIVRPETVTVLDYKTQRPPPREPSAVAPLYLKQMAAYRAVLGAVFPGRSIRCLLVWTDGPRIMALDDALLDRYAPAGA